MLIGAGWGLDELVPNRLEYWVPRGLNGASEDSPSDAAIVVPLDETKSDYERLYARAFDVLRRHMGIAAFERLALEIDLASSKDLVKTSWKREVATEPGSIPWPEGRALFDAITRQLVAVAKAAVSPQAQLGRSNTYFAQDFLAATILAPSGAGSYVVNALTPVHRHIYTSPPQDALAGRPMRERQSMEAVSVLATFDGALSVIARALEESNNQDQVLAMTTAPGRGVSHELLSALADFTAGHEAAVEVPRQAWTGATRPHEIAFKPADTRVLQEAATALSRSAEATLATVTGVVTKMEHEPESEDRVVRIFTTSRGPVRRVTVRLSEDDYDAALSAHRDDSLVRVRGQLAKLGRFWTIEGPQQFEVLDAGAESAVLGESQSLFSGDLPTEAEPDT
jgi:hypothetical protein